MKMLVTTSMLFFALRTEACPNLAGQWTCQNADGSRSAINIGQEPIENGILYHLTDSSGNTQDLPADGNIHSYSEGDWSGSVVANCPTDSSVRGTKSAVNSKMGLNEKVDIEATLISTDHLQSKTHSVLRFSGQPPQEMTIDSDCSRN